MYYDATYFLRRLRLVTPPVFGASFVANLFANCASIFIFASVAVSVGSTTAYADRLLIENPGPIVITFSIAEVFYAAGSEDPLQPGFRFDITRPEACRDGVNNDDHRRGGHGIQDTEIDYPADPDCVGPEDDSEDKPGLQPRQALSLTGTIDSEGVFHIPVAGIIIPPRYTQSDQRGLGGDRVVVNTFEATHDVNGRLDPFTGEMTLRLRYRMGFEVEGTGRFTGPGDECFLGSVSEPHDFVLRTGTAVMTASTQGVGGQPYDWRDGSFGVAGTNVATVSSATCCGFLCFGDSKINESFGAPVELGTMLMIGTGRILPAPIPAIRPIHVQASSDVDDADASVSVSVENSMRGREVAASDRNTTSGFDVAAK